MREVNGVTGIPWEQSGAGMEQGGGSIPGITLEGKTEGRDVPNFLHSWKSWISPFCPCGCGACGDTAWLVSCLSCSTAFWDLWAVQRRCSCFSQVPVHLLPFQFPSWTQMDLFGSRQWSSSSSHCGSSGMFNNSSDIGVCPRWKLFQWASGAVGKCQVRLPPSLLGSSGM